MFIININSIIYTIALPFLNIIWYHRQNWPTSIFYVKWPPLRLPQTIYWFRNFISHLQTLPLYTTWQQLRLQVTIISCVFTIFKMKNFLCDCSNPNPLFVISTQPMLFPIRPSQNGTYKIKSSLVPIPSLLENFFACSNGPKWPNTTIFGNF